MTTDKAVSLKPIFGESHFRDLQLDARTRQVSSRRPWINAAIMHESKSFLGIPFVHPSRLLAIYIESEERRSMKYQKFTFFRVPKISCIQIVSSNVYARRKSHGKLASNNIETCNSAISVILFFLALDREFRKCCTTTFGRNRCWT